MFAARDSQDNWRVWLYIEPPANAPEDWGMGRDVHQKDFASTGVGLQAETPAHTHTVQLLAEIVGGGGLGPPSRPE